MDAAQNQLSRDRIPMAGLLEDVEVGVAAVHLRGTAAALARQLVGIARLPVRTAVREVVGAAEVEGHRQRSRWAIAASTPIAPTRMSDPGASSGGPMTRL